MSRSDSQSQSTRGARHTTLNAPPDGHVIAIPQSIPLGDIESNGPRSLNRPPSSYTSRAYEARNDGRPVVSENSNGDPKTTKSNSPLPSNNSTLPISLITTEVSENMGEQPHRAGPLLTNIAPALFNTPTSSLSSANDPINVEYPSNDGEPLPYSLKAKKRREKPRIELALDQPPTTQGKPRARVYVACLQWCAVPSSVQR
jgi:hypothetical protein